MDLKKLFNKSYEIVINYEPALKDFRLEEAEEKMDGSFDIVVSYLIEDNNKPIAIGLALMQTHRSYERIFKRLIFNKELEFKKLSIYKN